MANIILKKSSVTGRVPDSDDLVYGELALNYEDGKLYYKNTANEIKSFIDSAAIESLRATAGTGITVSGTEISIPQEIDTTSDVVFGSVSADSAVLNGISFNAVTDGYAADMPGTLYWDSDEQKGLSYVTRTREGAAGATINIGQELVIYVHNQTGEQVSNGDVVYVSGTAHGQHPSITKAQSDTSINGKIAVATMDIPDNTHGYVTVFGLVRDVNTGGIPAGTNLYVSADSAGTWTPTEVSIDDGYPFHVGKVVRSDSSTGSILVDPFAEHLEYLRIEDRLKVDGPIEGTSYMGTYFDFDGTAPAHKEGRIFYDSDNGALAVYNQVADITMQVGQEQWVKCYNNSGAAIANGKAVYVGASHGGTPAIELADANNDASAYALGLATHTIPNGTYGYVTISGIVNDVNTSAFNPGDRLHVSTTPGELQVAIPAFPAFTNEIGEVMLSDSTGGKILVNRQPHTFETIRSTGDARVDGNMTIGGNLNVVGSTTQARIDEVTVSSNFVKLLDGDTLSTAYQNYTDPPGLNDATFKGNYTGDSDIFFYIRMVSTDSSGDVIEFGLCDSDTCVGVYGQGPDSDQGYQVPFDSAGGPITWNLATDGLTAPLRDGVSIQFINATGHADSDLWCAHPTELNLDLGIVGNYNPPGVGGLRYAGIYRDAGDARWKFFDGSTQQFRDSESGQFEVIDSAGIGYNLSNIQFGTAFGDLSGNATTANTATILETSRSFEITGDVTATGQNFNGAANVSLATTLGAGVVDNSNVAAGAGIVDTKLATISTAGKIQNSATTATALNTASAIVARDGSGNFATNRITANQMHIDAYGEVVDSAGVWRGSPSGLKGETGDKGATGQKGDKGVDGIVGVDGTKGETGATGAKGQKGEVGQKGITGNTGATGDKGATGATGAAGANGAKGQKGEVGNTGNTGAVGAKGQKGEAGVNGTNGSKGQKGEVGNTGATGATGDKGATGATGSQGIQGNKGDTGATGSTGSTGAKGQKGEVGATGAQGIQGEKGQKGATGLTGATGATGSAGTNGDKGQKGEIGQKGDIGATGLTGATGSTGAKGQKGEVGQKGATGATGATGSTGGTGDKGQKGISATSTVSVSAPSGAADGDLWWDAETGSLYIYYNDGDSFQWIQFNNAIIPDGYITDAKLASSTITGSKIAGGTITQSKLANSTSLVIYNSSGTALKTLYGAGS